MDYLLAHPWWWRTHSKLFRMRLKQSLQLRTTLNGKTKRKSIQVRITLTTRLCCNSCPTTLRQRHGETPIARARLLRFSSIRFIRARLATRLKLCRLRIQLTRTTHHRVLTRKPNQANRERKVLAETALQLPCLCNPKVIVCLKPLEISIWSKTLTNNSLKFKVFIGRRCLSVAKMLRTG
jgi:hypothetical protein